MPDAIAGHDHILLMQLLQRKPQSQSSSHQLRPHPPPSSRVKAPSHSSPSPTLAAIAATAGVSKSTVSRALRGHAAIPAATVLRLTKVAQALGYRRSPLVGEVMRRIRGRGHFRGLAPVAYLTFDATPQAWRRQHTFMRFFDGARARAMQLGLQVEPFWMNEPGLTPQRAADIFEARGIEALLVGPTTGWARVPELEWARFCAVKVGTPLPGLPLPCACHHHFQGMTLLLAELARRGYRRPGLVLRDYQEAKTGGAWSAPLLRHQQQLASADRVPPLWLKDLSAGVFARWFKRHRPDVVIGQGNELPAWLEDLGRRVPADTGFADLDCCSPDRAGINQHSPAIGAAAVDLLLGRLLAHERGLPATGSIFMVEGTWADGPTIRAAPRG